MARWKTKDVATFEHDDRLNSTIIGEVKCLLCDWSAMPNAPTIFPIVDDTVERHLREAHPEVLNDAGVQRSPDEDLLVYYVITNL